MITIFVNPIKKQRYIDNMRVKKHFPVEKFNLYISTL